MDVFVIDDNELHLKMCRILLNNLGHQVHTASSLADMKNIAGDIEPDVALVDYRLSLGETGIDVLNYVKQQGLWKSCRIIALTADVSEKTSLEVAGFDKVVFKPVTEALLKEIVK